MFESILVPLLACAVVLALALAFVLAAVVAHYIGVGTVWRGVLNLLPGYARSFEKAYLELFVNRLCNTPALLVISGSDAARRDLSLIEAFSPISLRPDGDGAVGDSVPLDDTGRLRREIAELRSRPPRLTVRVLPPPSLRQRIVSIVLWVAAQVLPLLLALAVVLWLLWAPADGWRLAWLPITAAVVVGALWLLLARWIHTQLATLSIWWAKRSQCTADPGTPGDEIWQHPRLLIRGAPGSGKTTLLRHMALICARDRLGIAQRHHNDRVRDIYGWPARLFPIYVPLRALSLAAPDRKPLLRSYAESLSSIFGPDMPHCAPDFFVDRVKQGGCLILLDAFDELPSLDARTQIGLLVADLARIQPRRPNWIVVTSRIVGYEGQLDGADFVHRRVEELDNTQVKAFITARYLAIAATERRALGRSASASLGWRPEQRAQVLIQRLPEHPGLRQLSRNPLLLSLAVAVHHHQRGRGQDLPQERYRLYDEALKLLGDDWDRRKQAEYNPEAAVELGDLNVDEKLRLLRELAWAMFEQALDGADPRAHAVVSSDLAHNVLSRTLEQISGFAPEKVGDARTSYCRNEVANVLQRLNQRGGVLQELGNIPGTNAAQIQFAHLTFQEYLAACAAASEQQEQRRARLLRYWADTRWHEVLLLHAASADATPLVTHLLQQAGPDGALLAGAILIERPLKLDQDYRARVVQILRAFALEDPSVAEAVALKAFEILVAADALPERQMLLQALGQAPHIQVRVKIIGLLAGIELDSRGAPIGRALDEARGLVLSIPTAARGPRATPRRGFDNDR